MVQHTYCPASTSLAHTLEQGLASNLTTIVKALSLIIGTLDQDTGEG